MEKRPYRIHHLLELLETYEETNRPLDLYMSDYFRHHKAIGSKDRAEIAETAYALVRWRGLLDALSSTPYSWEKRHLAYTTYDLKEHAKREDLPAHTRVSFPETVFHLIAASHGEKEAERLCLISNTQAPTTVRINPEKTTREALLKKWEKKFSVSSCPRSPWGIRFHTKINFFQLPEFKEGLFEIQDEGSQLLADLIETKPGQHVLDYCAGSGGKTLAFAHKMERKGQIFLHDIRPYALQEGKKRLRRAGIQNAQMVLPTAPTLKKLKKKMDWVLADVPCSGTGTLRRNPDMKWRLTPKEIDFLVSQQRVIFEKALSFVKPGGFLVYGTCSLLNEENQQQVAHFLKTYPIELIKEPFCTLPEEGGMDGFFGAVFQTTVSP